MASKKEGIVVVSRQVQYVIVEVKVAENQIGKVDYAAWEEAKGDLDGAVKTVLDMVTALRSDMDALCRKMDGIQDAIRDDITAAKAYLEGTKARSTGDTDQAMNALNGCIDFTNKDIAATQQNLRTTQKSLSDCLNGIAVVKSGLERNAADTEARLEADMRQYTQGDDDIAELLRFHTSKAGDGQVRSYEYVDRRKEGQNDIVYNGDPQDELEGRQQGLRLAACLSAPAKDAPRGGCDWRPVMGSSALRQVSSSALPQHMPDDVVKIVADAKLQQPRVGQQQSEQQQEQQQGEQQHGQLLGEEAAATRLQAAAIEVALCEQALENAKAAMVDAAEAAAGMDE